jgi:hypothetical protein
MKLMVLLTLLCAETIVPAQNVEYNYAQGQGRISHKSLAEI